MTSHGRPVAKIVPMGERDKTAASARVALFAGLRAERTVKIGRWTRAELYDDVP